MIAIPTGLLKNLPKAGKVGEAGSKYLDDARHLRLPAINQAVQKIESFDSTALKQLQKDFPYISHQNYQGIINYAKFHEKTITEITVIELLDKIKKDPSNFTSHQDLLEQAILKVNSSIAAIDKLNPKIYTKPAKFILENSSAQIAENAARLAVNQYCNN
jgi:hypothetical protein